MSVCGNSSIILLFCFAFVFNYYLQHTIKFNLIFKRYTRSMYSGTVSLEYHADVTISIFLLFRLPFSLFFRPDRDTGRFDTIKHLFEPIGSISHSSAHSSTEFKKKKSVLFLFVFREFFHMFLYIIIYSNVKNHGPLNRT